MEVRAATWIKAHRALVGYLILLTALIVAAQANNMRTTRQIRNVQHDTCERVNVLVNNQERLRNWLIVLAHTMNQDPGVEPETRRIFRISIPIFAQSLVRLPTVYCKENR